MRIPVVLGAEFVGPVPGRPRTALHVELRESPTAWPGRPSRPGARHCPGPGPPPEAAPAQRCYDSTTIDTRTEPPHGATPRSDLAVLGLGQHGYGHARPPTRSRCRDIQFPEPDTKTSNFPPKPTKLSRIWVDATPTAPPRPRPTPTSNPPVPTPLQPPYPHPHYRTPASRPTNPPAPKPLQAANSVNVAV